MSRFQLIDSRLIQFIALGVFLSGCCSDKPVPHSRLSADDAISRNVARVDMGDFMDVDAVMDTDVELLVEVPKRIIGARAENIRVIAKNRGATHVDFAYSHSSDMGALDVHLIGPDGQQVPLTPDGKSAFGVGMTNLFSNTGKQLAHDDSYVWDFNLRSYFDFKSDGTYILSVRLRLNEMHPQNRFAVAVNNVMMQYSSKE